MSFAVLFFDITHVSPTWLITYGDTDKSGVADADPKPQKYPALQSPVGEVNPGEAQ